MFECGILEYVIFIFKHNFGHFWMLNYPQNVLTNGILGR